MIETIGSVVGVFPSEASLEEAASRLTLAGFDRAALSRPPSLMRPEQTATGVQVEAMLTETDQQQARTLGTSMAGAAAGLAAAGVAVATGGTAVVAAVAAVGIGGIAAATTAAIERGQEDTVHAENRADAELGELTLSVGPLTQAQVAQAETAMRSAGATRVLARRIAGEMV